MAKRKTMSNFSSNFTSVNSTTLTPNQAYFKQTTAFQLAHLSQGSSFKLTKPERLIQINNDNISDNPHLERFDNRSNEKNLNFL